jgi:hypothetical protein
MTDLAPPSKPPVPLLRLALLTATLTLAVYLLRIWWVEPVSPDIDPKGLRVLPFAAIFAFGLSVVITLALANRHRWRVVLWWNAGRIIGALVLAFVTPLVVYGWLPWILGILAGMFGPVALAEGDFRAFLLILGISAGAVALWYPISCLIVSGLTSRWTRVAVFCLMFWTAYSAIILVVGNQIFPL